MTWQTEYDNIFGIKHYQVCVGKKCSCHKEVKAFIQDLLDRKAREIEELKYEWDGLGLKKVPVIWQTHNQTIDDALSALKEE